MRKYGALIALLVFARRKKHHTGQPDAAHRLASVLTSEWRNLMKDEITELNTQTDVTPAPDSLSGIPKLNPEFRNIEQWF